MIRSGIRSTSTFLAVISFVLLAVYISAETASPLQEGLSATSVGRFGWENPPTNKFNEGLLCFTVTLNSIVKWTKDQKYELTFRLGDDDRAMTPDRGVIASANWVSKKMNVDGGRYSIAFNVLAPAVMIQSGKEQRFTISAGNRFKFASLEIGGQRKTISLDSKDTLYDAAKDGALTANWMLLWQNGTEKESLVVPVLVVMQHQPASVTLDGMNVVMLFSKPVDTVFLATPAGVQSWTGETAAGWEKELPKELTSSCELWSKALWSFPMECRESYDIAGEGPGAQVRIQNTYSYIEQSDDWKTPALRLAVLPPVLSYMKGRYPMNLPAKLRDLSCPTYYGRLEAVESGEVRYELPVPPIDHGIPLNVPANTAAIRQINDQVKAYITSSLGECARKPFPQMPGNSVRSLRDLTLTKFMLDEASRKLVDEHREVNFPYIISEKAEELFWETVVDPFSKKKYIHVTQGGRKYDQDAFASYKLSEIWKSFFWTQDTELLRKNWTWITRIYDVFNVLNDWAWMGSMCRDYGGAGIGIDMAVDSWTGLASMQAMAEAVGDENITRQVHYLRAKYALPLTARFCGYREYLETYDCHRFEEGQLANMLSEPNVDGKLEESRHYNTKWLGARGVSPQKYFAWGDAMVNGCQCHPGVYQFLADVIPQDMRNYLGWIDTYCPQWYECPPGIGLEKEPWTRLWITSRMLAPVALLHAMVKNESKEQMEQYCRSLFAPADNATPGFREFLKQGVPYLFGFTAAMDCPVRLSAWGQAKVLDGTYDKENRTAALRFSLQAKNDSAIIKLRCRETPVDIRINDRPVTRRASFDELQESRDGSWIEGKYLYIKIPSDETVQTIRLAFRKNE
ncbi:MAG: hypothetical protein HZC28_18410 [Spirochaetes bacterium]|nr:hypothetical protein [Spirochaetota bacterium]